jgi:hypothetical protein
MTTRRYIVCSNRGDFAALLNRRMRDHWLWQARETEQLMAEFFEEVIEALKAHTVTSTERTAVLPFPEPSTHNPTNRRLNL